jgi:transposase
MIFNFTDTTRFYLFRDPVDMRKGIHSLYHLVQTTKKMDALSGDSFVFIGRTRKSIKILRWQKEGFVLYYKKLELGRYSLPHTVGDELFFEVESDIIDRMVNIVKHRSSSNELRRKVMVTL